MDTVFKELSRLDETGNFGVLLTVIFVFLLYLMAIVVAKRADRRDQAKVTRSSKIFKNFSLSSSNTILRSYECLENFIRCKYILSISKSLNQRIRFHLFTQNVRLFHLFPDRIFLYFNQLGPKVVLETEGNLISHQYELTISTGVWPDSGTTAKVTMVFHGSSGNSGPITVCRDLDPPRVLLARGSVDKYIMPLSTSLGTLHHAYIWHDNSGESPSWFLDHIIVREIETSREWKLICNQWFSSDKDDGNIVRKLSVEKTNSLPAFQEAFRKTLSGTLYESHLWMSSVTKRPGSSFTRVQRVTCCFCVVSTTMLVNAMFFNLSSEAEGAIKIGPLKVSMRQVIITLQSCLIIAPINFLIVAIFKNSKPTVGRYCGKVYKVTEEQGSDDDDKRLHHVFVYVAWFLCFATAITSTTVVFFYSLMWHKETADEWLSSIVMSITMDFFAIQPVRHVILAAVAAIVITKAKQTKERLSSKKRYTHTLLHVLFLISKT